MYCIPTTTALSRKIPQKTKHTMLTLFVIVRWILVVEVIVVVTLVVHSSRSTAAAAATAAFVVLPVALQQQQHRHNVHSLFAASEKNVKKNDKTTTTTTTTKNTARTTPEQQVSTRVIGTPSSENVIPIGPTTASDTDIRTTTITIENINDGDVVKRPKKSAQQYIRPSAAIERGSGFFIPGLEGYKVRLFVGSIILSLLTILPLLSSSSTSFNDRTMSYSNSGNVFAVNLTIFYGGLLLLQGLIEAWKDQNNSSNSSSSSSSVTAISSSSTTTPTTSNYISTVRTYQQQWLVPQVGYDDIDNLEWRTKVEWIASTYLTLTCTTNMILLSRKYNAIIYTLGGITTNNESNNNEERIQEGCAAAFQTLDQSLSGQVALPMNHRSIQILLQHQPQQQEEESLLAKESNSNSSMNDNNTIESPSFSNIYRTAILQRINNDLCWMITSDQILQKYTSSSYDLQWLQQLALYTQPTNKNQ